MVVLSINSVCSHNEFNRDVSDVAAADDEDGHDDDDVKECNDSQSDFILSGATAPLLCLTLYWQA